MHRKQMFRIILGILAIMAPTLILGGSAWATGGYKVLHMFKLDFRGFAPAGGLTFDAAGNLYGTTAGGGRYNAGTVFKLAPNLDGSWSERVLYSFQGGSDGSNPDSSLIFDAAGNLYGTTEWGGAHGQGTVFQLTPNGNGSWTERVLHSFHTYYDDGAGPIGGLTFDSAGNLYGTTYSGGAYQGGAVFELMPNRDGSWTESVLHSFSHSAGQSPTGGLIFDAAGNLYGTTAYGGALRAGTVFELTPNGDGSWTKSVLHLFHDRDGGWTPSGGLIFDATGNLYGTTRQGGARDKGVVFELTPNGDGSWGESVLHSFNGSDGEQPEGRLIFDAAGNLYGATSHGSSYGFGVIFKLTPTTADAWHYRVLRRFRNHPGANPLAGPVLDQAGNLYGTTYGDLTTTVGSVYEITP